MWSRRQLVKVTSVLLVDIGEELRLLVLVRRAFTRQTVSLARQGILLLFS